MIRKVLSARSRLLVCIKVKRPVLLTLLFLFSPAVSAVSIQIDLNTFTVNPPGSSITIAADGSAADFMEDFATPISLEGSLDLTADASKLLVDYRLVVPDDFNEDFFDIYVSDLTTTLYSVGGVGAATFEGTAEIDLSPYAGTTVPVVFDLLAGFGDFGFDSTLHIENPRVRLAAAPAPGVLSLLMAGLLVGYSTLRRGTA